MNDRALMEELVARVETSLGAERNDAVVAVALILRAQRYGPEKRRRFLAENVPSLKVSQVERDLRPSEIEDALTRLAEVLRRDRSAEEILWAFGEHPSTVALRLLTSTVLEPGLHTRNAVWQALCSLQKHAEVLPEKMSPEKMPDLHIWLARMQDHDDPDVASQAGWVVVTIERGALGRLGSGDDQSPDRSGWERGNRESD